MSKKLVARLLMVVMFVAFTSTALAIPKTFLTVNVIKASQEEVTFLAKWKGYQYCFADAIVTLSDHTNENSKKLYPEFIALEVPEEKTFVVKFSIPFTAEFMVNRWEILVRLIDYTNGEPFAQVSDCYLLKDK